MRPPLWPCVLCLNLVTACGERGAATDDAAIRAESGVAASIDTSASATSRRVADRELERAARYVVGFLRAEVPFDSLTLADSVELRVAPEGGGATRRVSRDALRDARTWIVGEGARSVRLIPPTAYAAATAAVGRHYRCQEQDLKPLAPDWAQRPHVGIRLQPSDGVPSCLQSWNATFVFDTGDGRPRLRGVLYDQWEW
jgi:hypothetical protein